MYSTIILYVTDHFFGAKVVMTENTNRDTDVSVHYDRFTCTPLLTSPVFFNTVYQRNQHSLPEQEKKLPEIGRRMEEEEEEEE